MTNPDPDQSRPVLVIHLHHCQNTCHRVQLFLIHLFNIYYVSDGTLVTRKLSCHKDDCVMCPI